MAKKVSLILTSYNCRDNIVRTLQSIEKQDYSDIEVVIVDGGSVDGTVDIIKKYANTTKFLCRWISEKDRGLYDAVNKGIRIASGDILAVFNDLFLVPNAVSLIVSAIEDGYCDGAHADLIYAEDDKVIRYWKMGNGNLKNGWLPGHPTMYLKKEVYKKYGLYNIKYKCSADYEFMVRMLKDGSVKLAYVPQTIVRMFYGGTSTGGIRNYWVSVRESHHALVVNGVKWAWWIIFMRTVRVIAQFFTAPKYAGKINEE